MSTRRWWRGTRGAWFAAAFWIVAAVTTAQSQPDKAAPAGRAKTKRALSPVAFSVSTPDPASHLFHVTLRCEVSARTVEFRMPVWTPGYYGLFDYAANVRNMSAVDERGKTLAIEKTGANSWTVQPGRPSRITLTYEVLATNPFVASAILDDTRAYITPSALFLYIPGQLKRPARVTIDLHPAWSGVATGLEPVRNAAAQTYSAADFDVLYDSPILVGKLESLPPFEIQGVPHRFVGIGFDDFDRRAFMNDLRDVVQAGVDIIGDLPYAHYTFIGTGQGRGGIEHLNSAAVSFTGPGADRAARLRTLAFLAHEYFHHYNVKRIRPVALGPFDYDRPNVTNMLWVSEGFTVYYEYLMLGRSGKMTAQEVLDSLSRSIAAIENSPGRLFQSATESSRETWKQGPFGRTSNTVPRTISYYEKGCVLGLLLDLRIREATKNRNSLDSVMRALYRRYAQKLGRGWTDEEFRAVCEEMAETSLTDIFEYASTTRAIDYERYLRAAGLQIEAPRPMTEASLGAYAEDISGALTVAAVEPGSAASRAGLAAGDVIASFDGTGLDAAGLKAALAAKKAGDTVRLVVRAAGTDPGSAGRPLDVALDARMERTWRLQPVANPTPLQASILASFTARQ